MLERDGVRNFEGGLAEFNRLASKIGPNQIPEPISVGSRNHGRFHNVREEACRHFTEHQVVDCKPGAAPRALCVDFIEEGQEAAQVSSPRGCHDFLHGGQPQGCDALELGSLCGRRRLLLSRQSVHPFGLVEDAAHARFHPPSRRSRQS